MAYCWVEYLKGLTNNELWTSRGMHAYVHAYYSVGTHVLLCVVDKRVEGRKRERGKKRERNLGN